MKHDFRYYTFNSLFSTDSYTENILLVENDLSENQLLRAQQLITFLNENVEEIVLKIDNYLKIGHLKELQNLKEQH